MRSPIAADGESVDQSSRQSQAERIVAFLKGAPILASVVYVVTLLLLWSVGRDVFHSEGGRGWLTWVALGFMAYGIVWTVVFVPRMTRISPEQATVVRWCLAYGPFVYGLAAVALGADQWVLTAGLIASLALVVSNARDIRVSA